MPCLRHLASQAVPAEQLKAFKNARQDASSPALELSTLHARVKNAAHIVLFIVNSASPNDRTNQGSGQKCYF